MAEHQPSKLIVAGSIPVSRSKVAGWSSQVARRAHNPEVAGSNPAPATIFDIVLLWSAHVAQ